jgi:hypothetical protein
MQAALWSKGGVGTETIMYRKIKGIQNRTHAFPSLSSFKHPLSLLCNPQQFVEERL